MNHESVMSCTSTTVNPPLSFYPEVTLADGTTALVDRAGLIIGEINGFDRVEYRWQPPDERDILQAMKWLERIKRAAGDRVSSYRLKHSCERWRGRYQSNGSLIVALQRTGFPLHSDRRSHFPLNVAVEIDYRAYAALPECRVSRSFRKGGRW